MTVYRVVATVIKVNTPSKVTDDSELHVSMPCRMYKVGDKIVFEDNQINMQETTGALCLTLIGGMIPVLKALQRSVEPAKDDDNKPVKDSTQGVNFYQCSDAERPVLFRIERIPLGDKPRWIIAEELARKSKSGGTHYHTPNPTDTARGDYDNQWGKTL